MPTTLAVSEIAADTGEPGRFDWREAEGVMVESCADAWDEMDLQIGRAHV